eukprot:6843595-Alexandrium_andersonii.AAC.1
MDWYSSTRAANRALPLYELQDFTEGMLGKPEHQTVGTKAAETGTLVMFASDMVQRYAHRLPEAAALRGCGQALLRYLEVTRHSPRRLTPGQ